MNMKEFVEAGVERVVEFANENDLNEIVFDVDEDLLATARVNGRMIESDDELYNEMVSLLTDDVIDEIVEGAENVLLE